MIKCDTCKLHGLTFRSTTIEPNQYIEGNPNSLIWIIGLNPKSPMGHIERRTLEQFKDFSPAFHRYFRDFKSVSESLYNNWLSDKSIISHTDLVKCFSESFPPTGLSKKHTNEIIQNCSPHLLKQISNYKPKLIICNGSDTSRQIMHLFPPDANLNKERITSYKATYKNFEFWIILSGFIGRVDNRNRRRLGKEIESICLSEGISL